MACHFKHLKTIAICFILMLIVGTTVTYAYDGFEKEVIPPEEQVKLLSQKEICLLDQEPLKRAIVSFDVSRNGLIAIGNVSEDHSHIIVTVYTTSGEFVYGYTISPYNGSFGVEWDDDNLLVHFRRGDITFVFDSSHTVIEVYGISDTIDNSSHWRYVKLKKSCQLGDTKYVVRNDLGLFNFINTQYSQLVVVNANGEENIIYDASNAMKGEIIVTLIFVSLFLATIVIAATMIIKKFYSAKQS